MQVEQDLLLPQAICTTSRPRRRRGRRRNPGGLARRQPEAQEV